MEQCRVPPPCPPIHLTCLHLPAQAHGPCLDSGKNIMLIQALSGRIMSYVMSCGGPWWSCEAQARGIDCIMCPQLAVSQQWLRRPSNAAGHISN
eukprot:1142696-Pelagomonas_calceolata.AAC.4